MTAALYLRVIGASVVLSACGGTDAGDDVAGDDLVIIDMPDAPDATVAFRDGDGEWMTAPGTSAPISFAAPSGSYSVAVLCRPASAIGNVAVYNLTTSDTRTLLHAAECRTSAKGASIRGSLVHASAGEEIHWGQFDSYFANSPEPHYEFPATPGTHDFVASRFFGGPIIDRGIVERALSVSAPSNVDLDFEGTNSFAFVRTPIYVNGAPIDDASTTLYTQSTVASLSFGPYAPTFPPEVGAPTDLYAIAYGRCIALENPRPCRSATRIVHAPSGATTIDLTLPIGTSNVPDLAFQGESSFEFHASWPTAPIASMYELTVQQFDTPSWRVISSQNFVGDHPVTISTLNLTSVPGWDPAAAVRQDEVTIWNVEAFDGWTPEALQPIPVSERETTTTGWGGELAPL